MPRTPAPAGPITVQATSGGANDAGLATVVPNRVARPAGEESRGSKTPKDRTGDALPEPPSGQGGPPPRALRHGPTVEVVPPHAPPHEAKTPSDTPAPGAVDRRPLPLVVVGAHALTVTKDARALPKAAGVAPQEPLARLRRAAPAPTPIAALPRAARPCRSALLANLSWRTPREETYLLVEEFLLAGRHTSSRGLSLLAGVVPHGLVSSSSSGGPG